MSSDLLRRFITLLETAQTPTEPDAVQETDWEAAADQVLAPFLAKAANPKVQGWLTTTARPWVAENLKYEDRTAEEMAGDLAVAVEFLNGLDRPDLSNATTVPYVVRAAKQRQTAQFAHHRLTPVAQTPEFRAWFGNSVVVDGAGQPLIVFRGTARVPKETGFGTKRAVPSFVASADIASVYAASTEMWTLGYHKGATVSPVYLSMQNPVRFPSSEMITLDDLATMLNADLEGSEDDQDYLLSIVKALKNRDANGEMPFNYELPAGGMLGGMDWEDLVNALQRALTRGNSDRVYALTSATEVDVYAIVDTLAFVEWAKEKGFDGAIHLDVFDVGAQHAPRLIGKEPEEMFGLRDETHKTYRPFYRWQVKSAIGNRGTWNRDSDSMVEARSGD